MKLSIMTYARRNLLCEANPEGQETNNLDPSVHSGYFSGYTFTISKIDLPALCMVYLSNLFHALILTGEIFRYTDS